MRYDAGDVITAMVTPFNEKREVDYDKVETLAYQLANTGSDAVLVTGTTGEAPTLSYDEEIEILCSVKRAVNKQAKVIMGTGSNSTETAVKMSKLAEKEGADAILSVVPYYNKPSQAGMIEHFSAVAEAVDLPIILYNIPSRTGINIDIDVINELKKEKNIIGIKEASKDINHIIEVSTLCDSNFSLYCGNDELLITFLSLNAKGVISVLSNLKPRVMKNILKIYEENPYLSFQYFKENYSLFNSISLDINPIPIKTLMNYANMNVGWFRLPLAKTNEVNQQKLIDIFNNFV